MTNDVGQIKYIPGYQIPLQHSCQNPEPRTLYKTAPEALVSALAAVCCLSTSLLPPQGHELSSGDRVTITTENGLTCLVIENITADDSGKYVVSVENTLGADCTFASVAVEGTSVYVSRRSGRQELCYGYVHSRAVNRARGWRVRRAEGC